MTVGFVGFALIAAKHFPRLSVLDQAEKRKAVFAV